MFTRLHRSFHALLLFGTAVGMLSGATLEQLSETRLIDESTEIVRGTVVYCNQTYRQPVIWTVCEVNVTERFKGAPGQRVQVAVPGGTAGGYRQSFEGAPSLSRNTEYLFFLWQGKSGLKQIMGLSQGLLGITRDANGNLMVVRGKSEAEMRDPKGKIVEDVGVTMRLDSLRQRISGRQSAGARR